MKILFLVALFMLSFVAFCEEPYIHPDMKQAIDENEKLLKAGLPLPEDFILLNGLKHHTGFRPLMQSYIGADFVNMKADDVVLPKKFDMREKSFSPVRGQIQGSCWAEGNVSAFELTWNFIKQTKTVFAVNDVIDCSGFGSAASGGQLSMGYDVKAGLAFESDYKYTGKDGRCKKDIARHQALKAAPFLRGATGKFPTEKELMAAAYQYGAMEVCGSAGALGSGGRQDNPGNGPTNHCYAYAGWLDGKEMGWLDAKYHIIKNSWGDGWGDKGYAYMSEEYVTWKKTWDIWVPTIGKDFGKP